MSRFKMLFTLMLSIFILFIIAPANAETTTQTVVVEKKIISSPAPQSMDCTTIKAHWDNNVWIGDQTVCKYSNRAEGVAWINNYWSCKAYNKDTLTCTNWELQPGYWVKTLPQS